jgi:hypothetical protein
MDKTKTVCNFNLTPETLQKIKNGAKNSALSESQFIAACIEYFYLKEIPCQNKKEAIPFK